VRALRAGLFIIGPAVGLVMLSGWWGNAWFWAGVAWAAVWLTVAGLEALSSESG
jgi:hypothetical protein